MKLTLAPCLQYVAALLAAVIYSCVGTQRGWSSPMVPRLLSNETHFSCTMDQVSWMISSRSLSKLGYTIVFYFVVNRFGRKTFILASCVPALASWLIIAFARTCEELIAARVLDGLTATVLYVVPSIYISEISRVEVRGLFVVLKEFAEGLGDLLVLSIAPHVPYQVLPLIPATIPAVGFLTFIWMPESPYYYLLKNRKDLAEDALRRLRGVDDVSEELQKMQDFVDQAAHDGRPKFVEIVNTPPKRLSLTIGLVLLVSMIWSGNTVFGEYKTLIFRLSHTGKEAADTNAVIILAVQLVSLILTVLSVDRLGRRPLLIFSSTVCALMMSVGASSFLMATIPPWLPITWTAIFISAYTCGVGNLPWTIISEILPANVKMISVTCLSFGLGVSSTSALKLIPVFIDAWGVATVLWCCAAVAIITLVFVVLFVPETKSKQFAEIQKDLEGITRGRLLCCQRYEVKEGGLPGE